MTERSLRAKLVKHAEDLLDDLAKKKDVPINDRIEALKAVTTLDLGIEKLSGKVPDEGDGPDMREWARKIGGAEKQADA